MQSPQQAELHSAAVLRLATPDNPKPHVQFPVVHGARSARVVDPVARELMDGLLADRPDLAAYPEAVGQWAAVQARRYLYARFHDEHGLLDERGNIRGGVNYLSTERLAVTMNERLGLDPMGEARLRKTQAEAASVVVDLEAVRSRGRDALTRRDGATSGGAA